MPIDFRSGSMKYSEAERARKAAAGYQGMEGAPSLSSGTAAERKGGYTVGWPSAETTFIPTGPGTDKK